MNVRINNKIELLLLLVLILLFSSFIDAATIGSDSAPTRFDTQQLLQSGDRVAGFAALAAGFNIQDNLTTATFDSFFSVEGSIAFNFGKLYLNQDLYLHDRSSIANLGSIIGNNHSIHLPCHRGNFPEGNTVLSCDVEFATQSVRSDDVESVDWSRVNDGKLFVAIGLDDTSVHPNYLEIFEFNPNTSTLTLRQSSPLVAAIEVISVRWHPSQYLLAVGTLVSSGAELLIYSFNPTTFVLTLMSSINLGINVNALAWRPQGDLLLVGKADTASEIALYAFISPGVIDPTPRSTINLSPNRNVNTQALDWRLDGAFMVAGTNAASSAPELLVYSLNTTTSVLSLNSSLLYNAGVTAVSWNKSLVNRIAVALDATNPKIRVVQVDTGGGSIAQELQYSSSPTDPAARSISWDNTGGCINVTFDNGVNGEYRTYTYDPAPTATLVLVNQFNYSDDVDSVRFSADNKYVAIGTDSDILAIYKNLGGFTANDFPCPIWTDVCVYLNADITLNNSCLTFSGVSEIHGQGYCLSLDSTSSIVVAPNSSLLFDNVIVKGLHNNQIKNQDRTGTITFKDTELILDGNYSFTVGHFDVDNNLHIIGDGLSFIYSSTGICTVQNQSRIILDRGVTLSYEPTIANRSLLQFVDSTSQLVLLGATLHTTRTGLALTNGTMVIDRNSLLKTDGSAKSEAIKFGDGVNSSNNFAIQNFPAATLAGVNAVIDYANV